MRRGKLPAKTIMAMKLAALLLLQACDNHDGPPLNPREALKTFALPDGYRIELVAAEPLVTDPVEIAFDGNGLLYVAEMEDYPADAAPGGRIVLLEDRNGDGYFEHGDTFADSLPYVNGVMPWGRGVLVTSAPDVLYLEDTTGDRRAHIRRVVLTGFALTNPQLRMSSLRYGLDNWIYAAYSRSGGQRGYPQFTNHGLPLSFPDSPQRDSADIYPGTDVRFRPGEYRVEPSGGMSQFGLAFDAAGNRFTVWNNIHLRHVVIDARYQRGQLSLVGAPPMAHISDHGDAATVFSRAEGRLDLHESEIGHFTSACGISVYTGGLFYAPYDNAAFVCEPVANLVHADILTEKGPTFAASRDREREEFLTSTDPWFRPVNTTVGPDGGLYIVDFYRKLVEHPAWIARADEKGIYTHAGVLQEADFLEGNDKGRIYRIVPESFRRADHPLPALESGDVPALVHALSHPNMWWRLNAQRILVSRGDTSAIPLLADIVRLTTSSPGKVHALRTLEGLGALTDSLVLIALADADPLVRKQGVLLSEPRLANAQILERILALTSDGDEAVELQVALTLSTAQVAPIPTKLLALFRRHVDDPWFRQAAVFCAAGNVIPWYQAVRDLKPEGQQRTGYLLLLRRIASLCDDNADISALLASVTRERDSAIRHTALRGLAEGIRPGKKRLHTTTEQALLSLIASTTPQTQVVALAVAERVSLAQSPMLSTLLSGARQTAVDVTSPVEERIRAIRVMALDPSDTSIGVMAQLLRPQQPEAVRATAARALSGFDNPAAIRTLLQQWPSFGSATRLAVENSFTGSSRRLPLLLEALEEGTLQPSWVSRTTRTRLAHHPDTTIRARAGKVFAAVKDEKRDDVVTAFYEATTLPGRAANGRAVFKRSCSACHELGNVGRRFGPDLRSVGNQTRINLLTMILDPNNNIAPGYDGYIIETTGGQTLTGILESESTSAVRLRSPDGNEHALARADIKSIRPMSESLMPDGLEAGHDKQDLADLLTYLKEIGH